MRGIWIVLKKEVVDNLRDRRSLSTSLLTPLISPLIVVALIFVIGKTLYVDEQAVAMRLPVAGAENAPALVEFLEQNNIEVVVAPADPEAAVREGEATVVLLIPEGYAADLSAGRPAALELVLDSSRQSAAVDIRRTQGLLQQYSRTVALLRLQARGIDPNIVSPLNLSTRDVATPQAQTLIFLNILPFLIIMTIFMGGMYVVIDTTAGERERGSLEPLLINPVPRWQMVTGKLLSSLPFAAASLGLTLVLLYLAFNLIPFEEIVGISMEIQWQSLWLFFLLSVPLLIFASVAQMLVATYTRSFKEAQTYLSFLPLVAGMPSMFLAFMPVKPGVVTMLIPAYSQSILINQIMRGETLLTENIVLSTAATLVLSAVLIAVSFSLYERERIVFGR
ncbi:MAG TPA: ABC transporter permease [Anaerolineaceae bacterium]|nr:ABC transporter permease [Anaerolineaceae bacterium]